MRISKYVVFAFLLMCWAVTFGCGGGGGGSSDSGSSGTGTISMSMTDAKPMLPAGVTNCFITIDEVWVHKSGGSWEPLPMVETPYKIDLLQFIEGVTTEFVPPVAIKSGSYTQVRLSVLSARLRFNNDSSDEVEITIPSENLKTDKNFDFTVPVDDDGDEVQNAAVDITIDFDLSKSIVVTGTPGSQSYQLKPVLHIVETDDAATIEGIIDNGLIPGSYAVITVFDTTVDEQEYTKVKVFKDENAPNSQTPYSIFWLVPNQAYTVAINFNPEEDDDINTPEIEEIQDGTVPVPSIDDTAYPDGTLPPGAIYLLNFEEPA